MKAINIFRIIKKLLETANNNVLALKNSKKYFFEFFNISSSFRFLALILIWVFVLLISSSFVFAQESAQSKYPFQQQYGISGQGAPDITKCSQSVKGCILWAFNIAFSVLIWIAGAFGVIMFAYAGILYITKPQESAKIHSRLYWGALGIIVALMSFGIVKFIEFNLTRNVGAINNTPILGAPFSASLQGKQIAFAAANPLDQFRGSFERVRPSGISGCQNAKTIFNYITKSGLHKEEIPSGLLGKCVLGFIGTKLLPIIYTISLLWTVAILIWLGLEYAQAGKSDPGLHQKFLYAIIGVVVTVLAFSLVKAIEIALTVPENAVPTEQQGTGVGTGANTTTTEEKCADETALRETIEDLFDEMITLRASFGAKSVDFYFPKNDKFGLNEEGNRGYRLGVQELIYAKAIFEERKCKGQETEDQERWARIVSNKINQLSKYTAENAEQSLEAYYKEFAPDETPPIEQMEQKNQTPPSEDFGGIPMD